MSIGSINPDYFSFDDSSSFEETPLSEPVLPPAESFDPVTLIVWEHFHTMPLYDGNTLKYFIQQQHALEIRLFGPATQTNSDEATEERERYSCPVKDCPVRYSFFKDSLIEHVRKKHPDQKDVLKTLFPKKQKEKPKEKPTIFICPDPACAKEYSIRDSLTQHIRRRHTKKSVQKTALL